MNTDLNTFLQYPKNTQSTLHHSELKKIDSYGNKVWIQLPNNLIQTRYFLNVIQLKFNPSDPTDVIREELLKVTTVNDTVKHGSKYNGYFLIGESPIRGLFYNITQQINESIDSDKILNKLRGRSVLYIYQTKIGKNDLLSNKGVSKFINETLNSYIEYYGTDSILGFSIELPKYLSILSSNGLMIPWTNSITDYIENCLDSIDSDLSSINNQSLLPSIFFETHNSPIIRGIYWQYLTFKFKTCFLDTINAYCNDKSLQFAVTINESARCLQYDLGTLLSNIDFPILISDDTDTTRRFVVVKSLCSQSRQVGIVRKNEHTTLLCQNDASKGFTEWLNYDCRSIQNVPNTIGYLHKNLINGDPIRPILILSPIQSLWMKPDEKEWNKITSQFAWLCDCVWKLGYDFDIVSEKQLASGIIDTSNRSITIEDTIYQLVLIPSCISLHEISVKRLKEFTKSKGKLVFNNPSPYLLNGKIGLAPYQLEKLIYGRSTYILDGTPTEREEKLRRCFSKWANLNINVYYHNKENRAEEIKVHERKIANGNIYYLFNSVSNNIHTIIEFSGDNQSIVEIDLKNGDILHPEYRNANKKTYHDCIFSPMQPRLFIVKNTDI
ncbi:hypothetical protein JT359_11195 [Candidatus Poribacteria bacterium]|nr:hypothetical protein [Candidatus Poribacteria bacterium]